MKSEPHDSTKAFATIRIAGDRLVPDAVTKILHVVPTGAYAKGALYSGGSRSPDLVGKTGVWYFSTDQFVASPRLNDHLALIAWLLLRDNAAPLANLHQLIERKSLRCALTCFWHGRPGAKEPSIPRSFTEMARLLPAEIETDFDTDEDAGGRQVA